MIGAFPYLDYPAYFERSLGKLHGALARDDVTGIGPLGERCLMDNCFFGSDRRLGCPWDVPELGLFFMEIHNNKLFLSHSDQC